MFRIDDNQLMLTVVEIDQGHDAVCIGLETV